MVLRFILGPVALIVILVELGLHMDGHKDIAIAFYAGCAAAVFGVLVAAIRHYW